jgi:hypothetical protein
MACTLDSKTLNVKSWATDDDYLGSQATQWISGAVKRKVNVLAKVTVHKITCMENGVTWANSNAKYFSEKITGASLTLYSDLAVRAVASVSVTVLSVSMTAENDEYLQRYYTITVQEV